MKQTKQYEYVDLGLPSGLKWAKCNIGAETETDYGDYFQWGYATPNTADECNWASYKYCVGSYNILTKYNTSTLHGENPDNITKLESKDDAASQIMGNKWRMPTKDEFDELLSGTTNEYIENFNDTGVNGIKFTSKIDTSKYIFIPAAGYCDNGSVFGGGIYSGVWSSSLNVLIPVYAWYLFLGPSYYGVDDDGFRFGGFSVRGVTT